MINGLDKLQSFMVGRRCLVNRFGLGNMIRSQSDNLDLVTWYAIFRSKTFSTNSQCNLL